MNRPDFQRESVFGRAPRMSLAMPNYNHAEYIEEALTAISKQTMLPFEVVVVDDGSTDDSIARLHSLAPKMPWLRIHGHPENRGVVAAMNTGLALVSGDFVMGTAADDRLGIQTVERAFAAATEFPTAGIIFSDQAEMSADGAVTRIVPLDLPAARRYFSKSDFIRLLQRSFFSFHVSSVWFNTELVRSLGGYRADLRWHADLFMAYAAAVERGAVYVPGAVSYFRRLPYSYSTGALGRDQNKVLHAWLAATREPGWEDRRAAFVAAAIWPEFSLRAISVLWSDLRYVTPRLVARLVWLAFWTKIAPLVSVNIRRWMRGLRSRYRRSRSLTR